MASLAPRWEWRTFGSGFGDVETRIRVFPSERRESSDTYIVSSHSEINTTIRDQKLDVKALQQVDRHGLELWLPVMKAGFPLTPESLDAAFRAWGLTPPAPADRIWTLQAFLRDIVAAQPSLTSVDVTKRRYGFVLDDCLVEIADLTFDGKPVRTIAVEMSDPERVWRTVQALGLSAYENVNYVKALKRFIAIPTR